MKTTLTDISSPTQPPAQLKTQEPLSAHCSLRIGGEASFWGVIQTPQMLQEVITWANSCKLPVTVLGLGSNVLISDKGVSGVVLRLGGEFAKALLQEEDDGASQRVAVGAGMVNAHLVRWLLKQQLLGAEFLSLIPGTMGGAVAMNAGIKEKELADILESVKLLNLDDLQVVEYKAEFLNLSYRSCKLPNRHIVLQATLKVEKATLQEVEQAKAFIKAQKEMRNKTQPYKLRSVGSTFCNPPNDFAGRLIDFCGLKGRKVGGACVSPLHANFFINEGGATAQEFAQLMELVQNTVYQKTGVKLYPEVRRIGDFEGELWFIKEDA